jgi:hypothetical protein
MSMFATPTAIGTPNLFAGNGIERIRPTQSSSRLALLKKV